MTRKYHNHKQQKNHGTVMKSHTPITRHQKDKQNKATSSLFPIKIIAKLERTQNNTHKTITGSNNENSNQQRINNNRPTVLERTAA